MDQKTFVALFCENKEKPELECNGHCQINQMTQDNESDHSSVLIPLMQAEIFLFLEAPFQLQTKDAEFVASEQAERGGIAENSYTFDFYTSQEKPPTTLVC